MQGSQEPESKAIVHSSGRKIQDHDGGGIMDRRNAPLSDTVNSSFAQGCYYILRRIKGKCKICNALGCMMEYIMIRVGRWAGIAEMEASAGRWLAGGGTVTV